MIPSIAGHSLLSQEALKLDSNTELKEQTEWAAEVLGLADIEPRTEDIPRIKRFLVRQVNHQIRVDPDAAILKAITRGSRREEYRDNIAVDKATFDAVSVFLESYTEQTGETFDVVSSKR